MKPIPIEMRRRIGNATEKPCPQNCNRCIEACPSKSLTAPYTMSLLKCISFQTSLAAEKPCMGVPSKEMAGQIGWHIYGCDVCQDACPFNKDKMTGGVDFPSLDRLLPTMSPERIMEMSYEKIGEALGKKFWYISPKHLWKWKLNALTVLANGSCDKYKTSIRLGLVDPVRKVRVFTKKICKKLLIDGKK